MKDKHKTKEELIAELEELRRRNAELQATEPEHKKAEGAPAYEWGDLGDLLGAMEDGVCVITKQHDLKYVNRVLEREYGPCDYRKCYEYFHDRKEPCSWCKNEEVWAGKTVRWEWYSVKDGKTYDLMDTPLTNPDGSISSLKILRDITEHKRTEENLAESDGRFRSLVETASDVIWTLDLDLQYTYVSPSVTELLGYTVEEIMSLNPLDTLTPASRERVIRIFHEELSREMTKPRPKYTERFDDIEQYRFDDIEQHRKDGSIVWVEFNTTFLRDRDNRPVGVLGISRDITERKRAEEELQQARDELEKRVQERTAELVKANEQLQREITEREQTEEALRASEHRFQQIAENAREWIWEVDADGLYTYSSPIVQRILGYDPREIVGKKHFYDLFHPDDREETKQRAFEGFAKKEAFQEFLNRNVDKDGKTVWLSTSGVPLLDEQGDLLGYRGADTDITERKGTEKALQESRQLLQTILDASPIGIGYVEDRKLTWGNHAMLELFGLKKEEDYQGKSAGILYPTDREYERVGKIVYDGLKSKGEAETEAKFMRKDGSIFDGYLRISAPDPSQPKKGTIATIIDISERKRAEEALRESEEKYRTLVEETFDGLFVQKGAKIVFANSRMYEMLGYDEGELEGMDHWLVYHPDYQGLTRSRAQARMRGESVPSRYEVKLQRKDGASFDGEINAKVIKFGDEPGVQVWLKDISQRKRAEVELRRREQMLSGIMSASPVGISLSDGGKLKWASHAMVEMFGYREEDEYIGKRAEQFYFSEEEYNRVRNAFLKNAASGKAVEAEVRFRRKDGSVFLGSVRMNSLDPTISAKATITIISDITDRKRAEEALRESEEKYRTIVESIEEGYYEVDLAGNMVFCNDSLCRILGYTWAELIGMNNRQYMDQATARKVYRAFNRVYTMGTPVRMSPWDVIRKDGTTLSIENSVSLVKDSEGKPVGFRGVCIDITERKRQEDLLIQSERLKGVADLASGVAHNFNNLLQIILGHADFALFSMEDGNLDEVRSNLETILNRSRFGARVVKSLQHFTEAASGRASAEGKVFDLSDTVDQAVELSKPWWKTGAEKDGIEIFLNRNLTRGCLVEGRESELLEVLVNLIRNAAEALPEGGEIRIAITEENEEVVLTVQDSGIGISKDNLAGVFQPFRTTKGPQVLGMGLASALGIVRRHGGDISFESHEGKGATFTVRLPRARKPVEAPEPPAKPRVDFTLRILVVDDEPPIVRLLDKVLTRSGQTVLSAESGKEAIEVFRENPVDMVICDLGMPGTDGWEVFREIRAICEEKGLPKPHFVLVTGYSGQAREKDKIAESGVDGILDKPLSVAKLLGAIRKVVKRGQSRD